MAIEPGGALADREGQPSMTGTSSGAGDFRFHARIECEER